MKSKETFTRTEADEIIRLIQEKLKADTNRHKSIRNKIRKIGFYASDYGFRNGYTVKQFLSVAKIKTTQELDNAKDHHIVSSVKLRDQSDESYVICLCDEVLQQTSLKQHRFDFLRGDSDSKLPVEAYYPSLNLVIEFRERQHTEEVKFFDRKQTVSGVSRGEQRKLYDQRRREVLPEHGIKLIEFDYSDFKHTSSKKFIGDKMEDLKVVKGKLKEMMK